MYITTTCDLGGSYFKIWTIFFKIKCGYPTRILQHFLTKKYNYVNLYVFIGYRICPFIIEFQNIMDWMFVESTVGISRWFMLTTIYHELYQIKCWRVLEKQFHYPRGEPRWPSFKYSGGFSIFQLNNSINNFFLISNCVLDLS